MYFGYFIFYYPSVYTAIKSQTSNHNRLPRNFIRQKFPNFISYSKLSTSFDSRSSSKSLLISSMAAFYNSYSNTFIQRILFQIYKKVSVYILLHPCESNATTLIKIGKRYIKRFQYTFYCILVKVTRRP